MAERTDASDDTLVPPLRRAVELLREAPEPSATWRAGVVRAAFDAAVLPMPRTPRSNTRMWTAIAAAFVGMVIGGSAVYVAMRDRVAPAPIAAAPAVREPAGDARVRFTFLAPSASAVTIVGDFNHWNPTAVPLRRSADGKMWEVEIPLPPGRYAYAFLVDGVLARDPAAPQARDDDFGSSNSVLMVKGS